MERDHADRADHGRGDQSDRIEADAARLAEHGYRRLVTYTQKGNEAMRAINKKLGYREQPAWILVRRGV